ncbi:MAG: transketolase [Mesorhizobium sp.]|uniref:transketolase n=1 Tax=Mesorhizobium sp. TaxID=1871066 RepID=UPI000FE58267|nr:transketolase [Mesorhizobium sp.]RWI08729.1 MAG: transketolase [Mesorhizobium sp.]RWM85640.1 MAG: transketolase [Mesorhizobium sp.]TIO13909.1 MAG: transketolase [Mesorhizobium sp.]TIP94342.1 MAG: transketolase [Mesorhizobium sp.]TIQ54286.1 MAG: transketolase [Mesorhizobium sp.]
MLTNQSPPPPASFELLRERAHQLRRNMLVQARGKGQGYVGQALGTAEFLSALYFNEMRYDAARMDDPDRDRFLMSTGHYALSLWAVFAEIGLISRDVLPLYGKDAGPIDMTTFDAVLGVEITGGSLGQGLGQAVGMALGHKMDKRTCRIFIETSDGELQEGSTWEAAMSASAFRLDNLVALIDCNGIQADGAIVIDMEPIAAKWQAFGWDVAEIDGNDLEQVVNALVGARTRNGRPKAIVMRTKPGKGIPTLEAREKSHFIRVEAAEWEMLEQELERNYV